MGKKKKRSKPKKLFAGLSLTDGLSLGAVFLPIIQVFTEFADRPVATKVSFLKKKYLAVDNNNKVTSSSVMETAGTYLSAAAPKVGKRILSAVGVRNSRI